MEPGKWEDAVRATSHAHSPSPSPLSVTSEPDSTLLSRAVGAGCRGNLELWTYIERPDFFAAIGASDDEFERFLACLRWLLTRDLRTVKHPIAKPFNSILCVGSVSYYGCCCAGRIDEFRHFAEENTSIVTMTLRFSSSTLSRANPDLVLTLTTHRVKRS